MLSVQLRNPLYFLFSVSDFKSGDICIYGGGKQNRNLCCDGSYGAAVYVVFGLELLVAGNEGERGINIAGDFGSL